MKDMHEQDDRQRKGITLERILLCLILVLQLVILAGNGKLPTRDRPAPSAATKPQAAYDAAAKEPGHNSTAPEVTATEAPTAPFVPRGFSDMRNHMDSLLNQAMAEFEQMDSFINFDEGWSSLMVSPTLDIRDETDENEYVVVFSLPGMDGSDIEVSLDGRLLTVACSSEADTPYSSSFGSFVRSVWLPGPVGDRELARAVLTNGVLRIVVPKGEIDEMAVRNNRIN